MTGASLMASGRVPNTMRIFTRLIVGATAGNTGLGLALSQKLCRLMGGNILAESEIAKGSCFTIRIPMKSTSAARPGGPVEDLQQVQQAPRSGRPKILIIDDDLAVLDLVERILVKEGYEPLRAQSSHEGVMVAWRTKPQAILLDVFMPEMDGWEVLSALKADEELKACPVVLLTVSDDIQKGRELGAAGHLMKPINRDVLLRTLERCWAPSHRQDEGQKYEQAPA